MNYQEIDNFLKKSLQDKIKKTTNDKQVYIYFLNKIEKHTTHKYKFLHYLDEISVCDEACNMEDNFLIRCYNEYMYKYRNNIPKPSKSIYKIIKESVTKKYVSNLPKPFLTPEDKRVAAFGKKS